MVINELELGGAERVVVGLAGALRAHGYATAIISLGRDGTLAQTASYAGAEVLSLGLGRANPRVLGALTDALRCRAVDVLHLHLPRAGVLGRLVARRLGLHPVVYTEHNVWPGYGVIIRRLNQWTLPWTDHVVAVSQTVRRWLLAHGLPADRVTAIANGVDVDGLRRASVGGPSLRSVLGLPDTTPVVGTVANLHPRKGLETLIAAVARLHARWPDVHLAIIGRDDGMGGRLRSLAQDAGVEGNVHLLGPRNDVPAMLPEFTVFVLPSRAEGLPIALLEAMALAVPVVVTPVGGVAEVVEHERHGLHVPVGDAKALASALDRLLQAPEEAARFGRAAAERVTREFSLERMAEEHARLYTILGETRTGQSPAT